MRKKRPRSRIGDVKGIISVKRGEWEQLLASVRALIDVQTQLNRSRGIEVVHEKQQSRSKSRSRKLRITQVIGPDIDRTLPQTDRREEQFYLRNTCLNCGGEMLGNDKFCDRCGHPVSGYRQE